jgi:tetratricopeptide (TPR) repeat protein
MSDAAESAAERQRDIARTYDRVEAQVTWLLGERGIDDATVARAVIQRMRGEPVGAPLTTTGHRNVVGRLALLWLWRGPFLAPAFVASGPVRLERVAAGEETIAASVATLRALELAPTTDDPLLARLRGVLGEEDGIEKLWSLEEWALDERLTGTRTRLASTEGREVLDAVAAAVADRLNATLTEERGPLASAAEHIARARKQVGSATLDPARTRVEPAKLELALADVDAALAMEPDDVEALVLRAHIMVMSGADRERARRDVARALELDPDDGEAHVVRGLALQSEGDLAGAALAFTRAIECSRPAVSAYVYRGVLRVDGGDLDGAEQDAAIATRDLPRAPAGHWIRGRVRALRGDTSGALEAFELALALDRAHAASHASRADVYVEMGELQRALAEMDKAVTLSSAGTMFYNRGNVKLALRDLDGAESDFTRAIERDATDMQAHLNRGTARLLRGKREGALEDFRRAAEGDPTYPPARMKHGLLLLEMGRSREAVVELEAALACAPPDWAPRAEIERIVAGAR